jgi:hypothetical protein
MIRLLIASQGCYAQPNVVIVRRNETVNTLGMLVRSIKHELRLMELLS